MGPGRIFPRLSDRNLLGLENIGSGVWRWVAGRDCGNSKPANCCQAVDFVYFISGLHTLAAQGPCVSSLSACEDLKREVTQTGTPSLVTWSGDSSSAAGPPVSQTF